MPSTTTDLSLERRDFLQSLDKHRGFLRFAVQDLTDEQASATPTASQLCLGGLVKHVAFVESGWVDFIVEGTEAMEFRPEKLDVHTNSFRMLEGETLAGILADYEKVTNRTDEVLATVDLDLSHPLPSAPWFEPGASWSARRVFIHIVAETAQHAGHADILRETIDGQKSMG